VETHDLQEILTGIDRYLQRLGDIDPDRKKSYPTRRGVSLMLQPYYHVLQESRHQAMQTILLSYFKNKSEEAASDQKMAEDEPFNPDDSHPGHYSCQ
jgi:hypothetical protein